MLIADRSAAAAALCHGQNSVQNSPSEKAYVNKNAYSGLLFQKKKQKQENERTVAF